MALRDLSFKINEGEAVGLLGESGSGKSTLALSIMRLLPASARVCGGSVFLRDRNVLDLAECQMEKVRGKEVSLVFQDPSSSLHPFLNVGAQIREVLHAHDISRGRGRLEVEAVLRDVGFEETERIYNAYPHQLSGGQRQRVAIAQAIACQPRLLIADEPTSSLDTTVQSEILSLLRRLRDEHGLSILFISHDPAVLEEVADRILVMYAGRIVEQGQTVDVLTSPLHPFTSALVDCLGKGREEDDPRPTMAAVKDKLTSPSGCAFATQCPDKMNICAQKDPPAITVSHEREVRCFKHGE